MSRDAMYEETWLAEVERQAERRFGIPDNGYYAKRVQHRLAIGAERYGPDNYLTADCIKELLEETPDVGAYSLLEVRKRLAVAVVDEDHAWHLFECAVGGAYSDHHARMARTPA